MNAKSTTLRFVVQLPILLTVVCSLRAAQQDEPRVSNIGEWWYWRFPVEDAATEEYGNLIADMDRRRSSVRVGLDSVPEEIRTQAAYILRLRFFQRGGAPIGTPATRMRDYAGMGLREEEVVRVLALKVQQDPQFISRDTLLKLAALPNQAVARIAVRALLVLEKDGNDLARRIRGKGELSTQDRTILWLIGQVIEHHNTDRRMFEYGKTWGPVGKGAVQVAFRELDQLSGNLVDDGRWLLCIRVIRDARDPCGIEPFLRLACRRICEEPGDQPYDTTTKSMYPAMDALLDYQAEFPKWTKERVLNLDREQPFPCEDNTLVTALVAMLRPEGFQKWLIDLDAAIGNLPESRRQSKRQEDMLARLRDAYSKLNEIPVYRDSYPFSGKLR